MVNVLLCNREAVSVSLSKDRAQLIANAQDPTTHRLFLAIPDLELNVRAWGEFSVGGLINPKLWLTFYYAIEKLCLFHSPKTWL